VLRTIQGAIDDVLGQLTLQSLICREREVAVSPRAIALRMSRDSGAPPA
jgi:hypothetical protein